MTYNILFLLFKTAPMAFINTETVQSVYGGSSCCVILHPA